MCFNRFAMVNVGCLDLLAYFNYIVSLYENAGDPLLWLCELCGTPLLPAITLLGSNTAERIPPLWLGFCTVN